MFENASLSVSFNTLATLMDNLLASVYLFAQKVSHMISSDCKKIPFPEVIFVVLNR